MATFSPLFKVALIYLGISVILYAGGVHFTSNDNAFSNLISETSSNGSQQYTMSSNVSGIQPVIGSSGGAIGGFGFLDLLRVVGNGITFLVNIALAIPALFFSFPSFIQLFVGVPLAIIFMIAVVFFARSG